MVKSQASVDASGAYKKMTAEARRIKKAGTATVKELVELGKRHAQQYVPKHTQQTYNAIEGQTLPQADGSTKGSVFIELKARTDGPQTSQDVAKFMAADKWGRRTTGFTSGRPNFMALTRSYLDKIKKQVGIRNIKVRGNAVKTTIG